MSREALRFLEALEKQYDKSIKKFFTTLGRMRRMSESYNKNPIEELNAHFALTLFTRMTVTATSIASIVPNRNINAHCDFASIASLTRNILECELVLYFLCFDDVDKDEKDARILMMHLHDIYTRKAMFTDLGLMDFDEEKSYIDSSDQIRNAIILNKYFQTLPDRRQKEILSGKKTPFTQDDMLAKIGVHRGGFRGFYRFLSAQTHTGPISFYRNTDGSGRGFMTEKERDYIGLALCLAEQSLTRTIEPMRQTMSRVAS